MSIQLRGTSPAEALVAQKPPVSIWGGYVCADPFAHRGGTHHFPAESKTTPLSGQSHPSAWAKQPERKGRGIAGTDLAQVVPFPPMGGRVGTWQRLLLQAIQGGD